VEDFSRRDQNRESYLEPPQLFQGLKENVTRMMADMRAKSGQKGIDQHPVSFLPALERNLKLLRAGPP
jgi:hypothetical protein